MTTKRRSFGFGKYAALNLLLARWLLPLNNQELPFSYVTLGGTELRDVAHLAWIDRQLVHSIRSYERQPERFRLAMKSRAQLEASGISVDLREEDIFNYRRELEGHHIFYLDLEGVCGLSGHADSFEEWFYEDIIRPGDLLIITSYLGRNRGWSLTLSDFDIEFRRLRVTSESRKRELYQLAHPIFVINRALKRADLANELRLMPVGVMRYFDSSLMGLYAIRCEKGKTDLHEQIKNLRTFNCKRNGWTFTFGTEI